MYLQSTEAAPELQKVTKKNAATRYYPGGMAFPGGPKSKKAFWGLSVRSVSSPDTSGRALFLGHLLSFPVPLFPRLFHPRMCRTLTVWRVSAVLFEQKGSQQPYKKRPSRTEMLKNPKLKPKILTKDEVRFDSTVLFVFNFLLAFSQLMLNLCSLSGFFLHSLKFTEKGAISAFSYSKSQKKSR